MVRVLIGNSLSYLYYSGFFPVLHAVSPCRSPLVGTSLFGTLLNNKEVHREVSRIRRRRRRRTEAPGTKITGEGISFEGQGIQDDRPWHDARRDSNLKAAD